MIEAELNEEKKRDDAMIDLTKLHVVLSIMVLSLQSILIVCIINELGVVNKLKERFDERDVKHIISNINVPIVMNKLLLLFQDFQ